MSEFLLSDWTKIPVEESDMFKPKYVGGYDITGTGGGAGSIVYMYMRKPNFFHRTCTKFFLGWVWVDKK
jgi:hypothetical protein